MYVIDGAHRLLRGSGYFSMATVQRPLRWQPLKTMAVSVCWFPVYRGGQPSPISSEYNQEGDLAIVLGLHGKLYAWALLVEVFVKIFSVMPGHVAKLQMCHQHSVSTGWVERGRGDGLLLNMFHEQIGDDGRKGEPIAAPSVCSKNWFSNWKYVERRHSSVSCMTCATGMEVLSSRVWSSFNFSFSTCGASSTGTCVKTLVIGGNRVLQSDLPSYLSHSSTTQVSYLLRTLCILCISTCNLSINL